jgi:IrrE N-terminal-like domain
VTAVADLPEERRAHVAHYAKGALIAAGALGQIPTPLDAVGAALKLHPAEDLYNLADMPPSLRQRIKGLAGKVVGALAVGERTVLIDRSQSRPKQRFTHGHEIGHQGLPWHAQAYFADDNRTLDPYTRNELEAEASAYSAELLFNVGAFTDRAHSTRLGLASALELADVFQSSSTAAIRRYVEDSPRPCALLVLGRFPVYPNGMRSLKVLRTIESATFREQYGPTAHLFPATVPIGASPMGGAAYAALRGTLGTPVGSGEYALLDSRRGSKTLQYEVYSNTYAVFALLYPKPKFTRRKTVRAEWSSEPV